MRLVSLEAAAAGEEGAEAAGGGELFFVVAGGFCHLCALDFGRAKLMTSPKMV